MAKRTATDKSFPGGRSWRWLWEASIQRGLYRGALREREADSLPYRGAGFNRSVRVHQTVGEDIILPAEVR